MGKVKEILERKRGEINSNNVQVLHLHLSIIATTIALHLRELNSVKYEDLKKHIEGTHLRHELPITPVVHQFIVDHLDSPFEDIVTGIYGLLLIMDYTEQWLSAMKTVDPPTDELADSANLYIHTFISTIIPLASNFIEANNMLGDETSEALFMYSIELFNLCLVIASSTDGRKTAYQLFTSNVRQLYIKYPMPDALRGTVKWFNDRLRKL